MTKKIFIFLILALGAISPVLSWTQEKTDIPSAVIDKSLAEEPPLSQADIDAYIKIMPEMSRLMGDPQSAGQLAAGLNLSQIRFSYIIIKVPLAMALASGVDPKLLGLDSLPQALRPSDQELSLVKDNLEVLLEAAEETKRALGSGPGAAAQ